jgi:hypothetical protein
MEILVLLKQEETKLQYKLKAVQGAIVALNGASSASLGAQSVSHKRVTRKRKMSAAARAKISKATKARWAKFRADEAKKAK